MSVQWRTFNFFQKRLLASRHSGSPEDKENDEPATASSVLFAGEFNPRVAAAGQGELLFADAASGTVRLLRDSEVLEWQMHTQYVLHVRRLQASPFAVSVGSDEGEAPKIKVWKLDELDDSQNPRCVAEFPVIDERQLSNQLSAAAAESMQAPSVTDLDMTEDCTQIAVGLANGAVLLYENFLPKQGESALLRRGMQALRRAQSIATVTVLLAPVPMERGLDPVTRVLFRPTTESDRKTALFVCRTRSVRSVFTSVQGRPQVLLDEAEGCEYHCACLSDERQLVVARAEAVYFFDAEERGPCAGFGGEKRRVSWFRGHLVLVTAGERGDQSETVYVLDRRHKCKAFSGSFADDVIAVVPDTRRRALLVLTKSSLWRLQERELPQKMKILLRKHLFSIAISLAKAHGADAGYVAEIAKMQGDYLCERQEFAQAMEHYLTTIGHVPPSAVIRRFLDAQRIRLLTRYLSALHDKGVATPDHTTLLLNCFAKLQESESLDRFLLQSQGAISFDVDTAIAVCRQAGYSGHAANLAKRHHKNAEYLTICIDDEADITAAVAFLQDLAHADDALQPYHKMDTTAYECKLLDAASCLQTRGQVLLRQATTEQRQRLVSLMSHLCARAAAATVLDVTSTGQKSEERIAEARLKELKETAAPSEFCHIFVTEKEHVEDLLDYFRTFLASLLGTDESVSDTLLELYLQPDASADETEKKERRELALDMLTRLSEPSDRALALCRQYEFHDGATLLLEQRGHYAEIVAFLCEGVRADTVRLQDVLDACARYDSHDASVWLQALHCILHDEKSDDPLPLEEMEEVLRKIEEHGLLPPLMLVSALSRDARVPLGAAKPVLMRAIRAQEQSIAADTREIASYRADAARMRKQCQQLSSGAVTFQSTKCDQCSTALELPAVHFLCMHSFHAHCLDAHAASDRECPKCAPEKNKVRNMKHNMRHNKQSDHDLFFKQLGAAADGFEVVAEYFGRGVVH